MWKRIQKIAQAIWDRTDNVTKWFQVLAVCVAAWWTYSNFSVADKPFLEENLKPNLRIDAALAMNPGFVADTCLAQYTITVKNEGKVSFDVKGIYFQGWIGEMPQLQPRQPATYADAEQLSRGTKIVDQAIEEAYLFRHYSPGQQLTQSFTWIIRKPAAPNLIDFIVDVTAITNKQEVVGHGRGVKVNACPDH